MPGRHLYLRAILRIICMSLMCHLYLIVCHSYVTQILFFCHSYINRMSSYVILYLGVCHLYVLLYHLYTIHMYLYVIRMTLLCTCMSPVCVFWPFKLSIFMRSFNSVSTTLSPLISSSRTESPVLKRKGVFSPVLFWKLTKVLWKKLPWLCPLCAI